MIILKNGDTLRLTCEFQHKGDAINGAKLYAAIGKAGTLLGFDEMPGLNGTTTITGIVSDAEWTTYAVTVDIPISKVGVTQFPQTIEPGGGYEAYVKLTDIPDGEIFWHGPPNDITLDEVGGEVEVFQNLTVSYAKA